MPITRSRLFHERIRNFLNSSEEFFYESLYKDEIKRLQKQIPGIKITIVQPTRLDKDDRRYTCLITRKDI